MIDRPTDPATTDRIRALAIGLPDVAEKLSHGVANVDWDELAGLFAEAHAMVRRARRSG